MTPEQAINVLDSADVICGPDDISRALDEMASSISARLAKQNPLVLSVMGGAVVFTGQLLTRLKFPLDFDYIHVSRYGEDISGGELRWIATPHQPMEGRVVLVLDDILDEGITLAAIRERILSLGAAECLSAVFADKLIQRDKPITPDFVGVTVPDRFVFGFGMDICGKWRNLPAIYALPEQSKQAS